MRIGIGYDVHAFCTDAGDNYITICGIKLSYKYKLAAHSDGDVALHALTDAMLGSIAMGSIGQHFPSTDPQWQNAASKQFIEYANKLIIKQGWIVQNIDITIVCQEPKIMSFAVEMRLFIAEALQLQINQINVKAVTTEWLGSLGRGEGIAAHAAILIQKTTN